MRSGRGEDGDTAWATLSQVRRSTTPLPPVPRLPSAGLQGTPAVGQQLRDPARRVRGHPAERLPQVGERIDTQAPPSRRRAEQDRRRPPASLPANSQFFRLCRARHNHKNWLHLGSDRGGRTAAVLMGLVQSCKRLVNEPFAYLQDVLERVSTHRASRVDDLLPDRRVLSEPGALAGRKG